jgi:hypothetical protein
MTTLEKVVEIARKQTGIRSPTPSSALWQDLTIIGDDSDDFVIALTKEFGDWVRYWPWDEFLSFDEGIPILAPWRTLWSSLRLPWIETAFPNQEPKLRRLELGHIAAVIDKGEWFEPDA